MVSKSSNEVQEGQQIAQHEEREEEERRRWRVANEEVQRQVQNIVGQQQQSEAKQQQLALERHGQQFGRKWRSGRQVRGEIRERHSPAVVRRNGPAASSSSGLPGRSSVGSSASPVEPSSRWNDGQYYEFVGSPEFG